MQYTGVIAKGASSGGRASSAGRASSSKSSGSSSKSSGSSSSSSKSGSGVSASEVHTAPKVNSKPSSTTAKTTTAQKPSSTATQSTKKTYSNTGYTVGGDYQPRFQGGYSAPAGSVVYYPQYSALDYLIFWNLFNGTSQRNSSAVVVEPDGKEQVVKQEGVDSMYVVNWIVLILFVLALGAGIVYLVNKLSQKNGRAAKQAN